MDVLSVLSSRRIDMIKSRQRFISDYNEFNKILKDAKSRTRVLFCSYEELRKQGYSLTTHSCIEDKQVYIYLTTRYHEWKDKKFLPTTYIFRKDGKNDVIMAGADAHQSMQRAYKLPSFTEDKRVKSLLGITEKDSFGCAASPFLYYNEKFDKTEHQVYIYDLNSAYGYQLLSDKFPDTSHYKLFTKLKENQVGFLMDDQLTMVTTTGIQCDFVFDTMESPYKKWVQKIYKQKKEGKTEEERLKAKNLLNLAIGYLQRKNPFIRAFIVHSCNNFIKSLIDENTCMCNTDAIYSTVERPDLQLGVEIGQWKLEYVGLFRQKGMNYQKVDVKETSIRGVPKSWFSEDYNILVDHPPVMGNIFTLNKETLQVEERSFEV